MLEFGDSAYYIDLKAFDKAITMTTGKGENNVDTEEKITTDKDGKVTQTERFTRTSAKSKEVDATKYTLLNTCIEYILDYEDVQDDTLGMDRAFAQTPLGYKIAFNTLLHEGIIKEK